MAAFVKALTRAFSVGKTRVEPRDATCAVINAIMKMKIAVVAARIRQRGAREPQPGEDLLLGELQRRPPPPDAPSSEASLRGSTVYLSGRKHI